MNGYGRDEENQKKGGETVVTRETFGMTLLFFSVILLVFSIVGSYILGDIGVAITSFLYGSLGFFLFPFFAFCIYESLVMIAGKKFVSGKAVFRFACLTIGIFLIAHLASSTQFWGEGFGAYLNGCFTAAGTGISASTAGGALFGLVVYPALTYLTLPGAYVVFSLLLVGAAIFFIMGTSARALLVRPCARSRTDRKVEAKDRTTSPKLKAEENSENNYPNYNRDSDRSTRRPPLEDRPGNLRVFEEPVRRDRYDQPVQSYEESDSQPYLGRQTPYRTPSYFAEREEKISGEEEKKPVDARELLFSRDPAQNYWGNLAYNGDGYYNGRVRKSTVRPVTKETDRPMPNYSEDYHAQAEQTQRHVTRQIVEQRPSERESGYSFSLNYSNIPDYSKQQPGGRKSEDEERERTFSSERREEAEKNPAEKPREEFRLNDSPAERDFSARRREETEEIPEEHSRDEFRLDDSPVERAFSAVRREETEEIPEEHSRDEFRLDDSPAERSFSSDRKFEESPRENPRERTFEREEELSSERDSLRFGEEEMPNLFPDWSEDDREAPERESDFSARQDDDRSGADDFGDSYGFSEEEEDFSRRTETTDRESPRELSGREDLFEREEGLGDSRAMNGISRSRSDLFESDDLPDEEEPLDEPRTKIVPKPKRSMRPYQKPSLSLLKEYDDKITVPQEEIERNSAIIIDTLAGFRVDAEVTNVTVGPSVTRYDIDIPRNIALNSVTKRSGEIAMRLHARDGVNMYANNEAGKISIEVPNSVRATVGLLSVMDCDEYRSDKPGSLIFAIGKDIEGRNVCGNIPKMTHILVAGTTNAGKSVALNAMLVSLVCKYSPEELRLILVDPKRTEFIVYDGLPHLMINEIIGDAQKAIMALNWSIKEMERRYALFEQKTRSGVAVRNVDEYNANLTEDEEKLPKIVFVVDELADLMSVAKKDIEERIQRLTQKARAAGIHLVLATQRPSVDVITGVIKGNLPTRMAVRVIQEVDSRTILDESGAEKLLGMGDMLFKTGGMFNCLRVQGAFISSSELQAVVEDIKRNNDSYFDPEVSDYINRTEEVETEDEDSGDHSGGVVRRSGEEESLYVKSLAMVVKLGSASISLIQRRCGVGYNHAGKIMEWMEEKGYVSPFDGKAKARTVLLTKEEFESQYGPLD